MFSCKFRNIYDYVKIYLILKYCQFLDICIKFSTKFKILQIPAQIKLH